MDRETNTAVNIEIARPSVRMTANPLIGPVPNWKRNSAEMIVVRFESMIADSARAGTRGRPR